MSSPPRIGTLNNESFAMKKTLRGEMNKVKAKSTFERWMGAIRTGPVSGMFSRPSTRGRKKIVESDVNKNDAK